MADFTGSSHRADKPVEFRTLEGVALPHGGEGLVEAGPLPVGPGQSVVEVGPLFGDAELGQALALGGEVLFVSGTAGVADQGPGHDRECTVSPRQSGFSPYGATATSQLQAMPS